MELKLGKKPKKEDRRTLMFAKYLTPAFPPMPNYFSWVPYLEFGMMLNDQYGDCTIAGAGHQDMIWTTYNFNKYVPSDGDIVAAYTAITASENGGNGFDPSTGNNDNGCTCIDVLNYWRNTGIGGRKILAYALLQLQNKDQLKAAIMLFGGVYLGVNLPLSVRDVSDDNTKVWDVPSSGPTGKGSPGSWGGHLIIGIRFDIEGISFISWGQLYKMTWAFWMTYIDESYAVLSVDFLIARHGGSPTGFDLETLQSDLLGIPEIRTNS